MLRMRILEQERLKIDKLFCRVGKRNTYLAIACIHGFSGPDIRYGFRVIRSADNSVFRMKNACYQ